VSCSQREDINHCWEAVHFCMPKEAGGHCVCGDPDKSGSVCHCSSIHHSWEEKYCLELVRYFVTVFPHLLHSWRTDSSTM